MIWRCVHCNKEEMARFYRKIDVPLLPIPKIPSLPIYEAKGCGKTLPPVIQKLGN